MPSPIITITTGARPAGGASGPGGVVVGVSPQAQATATISNARRTQEL
jgi:hypothetical protein